MNAARVESMIEEATARAQVYSLTAYAEQESAYTADPDAKAAWATVARAGRERLAVLAGVAL